MFKYEQPKEEKNTKKPRAARGTGKEAKKTEEKLQNFTIEKLKWIDEQLIILFSSGATHQELMNSDGNWVVKSCPGLIFCPIFFRSPFFKFLFIAHL